jgi:hypothetical protein
VSATPASAIPAAIDGLLDLLVHDPRMIAAEVQVLDGPPVSAIAGPSTVLIVGGNGDEDDVLSVTSDLTESSLRRGDTSETFDIRCHLEHWQGGDDLRAARAAAFAALDVVKEALRRDPRLGGAVTRSRLTGSLSCAQLHFKGETGVGVPFTVRCEAL